MRETWPRTLLHLDNSTIGFTDCTVLQPNILICPDNYILNCRSNLSWYSNRSLTDRRDFGNIAIYLS